MRDSIEKFSKYLLNQLDALCEDVTTIVNLDRIFDRNPNAHMATKESFKASICKIKCNVKPFDHMLQEAVFLDELISILKKFECQSFENNGIIQDFDHISAYLLRTSLKGKEQCNVLMSFIKNNIENELLECDENMVIIDIARLQSKGISNKTISKISNSDESFRILDTKDDKLSQEEIIIKQELEDSYKEYQENHTISFVQCHKNIQKHYLNQLDSYHKEDINIIIESLKSLDVPEELCSIICATLNKDLSKRKKEESRNTSISMNLKQQSKSSYISDQEYKEIRKEIESYFDFYQMKAIRPLSAEERLYCAHLLLKIGTSKDLVKTFFYRTEKKPNFNNPIGLYNHTYDKLKFYEEKLDLTEGLETIQDYLKETFITDKDSYRFWKEAIKSELSEMMKKFPKSYEYELMVASNKQEKPVVKRKK